MLILLFKHTDKSHAMVGTLTQMSTAITNDFKVPAATFVFSHLSPGRLQSGKRNCSPEENATI